MNAAEFRDVVFSGTRSGKSPLTWGQRWMWDEAHRLAPHNSHLNMRIAVDVPESTTPDDVGAALRTLVERRESLRTVYRVGPDGVPEQDLLAEGRLTVEWRETTADGVRPVAHRLARELQHVPFSMEELPVRAGVVTAAGQPRRIVLVLFHMAVDGWDLGSVRGELRELLVAAARGTVAEAVSRRHPLDQAAYEQGPDALRVSERSVRHWRTQLARMPGTMFPAAAQPPESPRFADVCMASEALAVALYGLAERHRVSQPTVFTALVAALLARRAGSPACGFTVSCRNRTSADDATASGTFVQDVPVAVDLTGASLSDLLRRTWRAVVPAYAAGAYDPVRAAEAVREAARANRPDLSCGVNVEFGISGVEAAALERLADSVRSGTFRSEALFFRTAGREHDRPGRKFYLAANDYAGHVFAKVVADTTALPTRDVVTFLSDLELLAVRALADDRIDPLTVDLPPQWVLAAD